MDKSKIIKFFMKLDRLAAWILLVVVLLYAVSGYGLTKGIINPALARELHFNWLAALALIAFVIHTYYAIHLALMRWRIWNVFTKILLAIAYLVVIIFFVYVNSFYHQPSLETGDASSAVAAPVIQAEKIFTAQTLSYYNGQSGRPSYVAVNGLVYDLSSVFRGGVHAGYQAGQDLSAIFNSRHDGSLLSNFKVVGKYQP